MFGSFWQFFLLVFRQEPKPEPEADTETVERVEPEPAPFIPRPPTPPPMPNLELETLLGNLCSCLLIQNQSNSESLW